MPEILRIEMIEAEKLQEGWLLAFDSSSGEPFKLRVAETRELSNGMQRFWGKVASCVHRDRTFRSCLRANAESLVLCEFPDGGSIFSPIHPDLRVPIIKEPHRTQVSDSDQKAYNEILQFAMRKPPWEI